jgi:hypothetical protein
MHLCCHRVLTRSFRLSLHGSAVSAIYPTSPFLDIFAIQSSRKLKLAVCPLPRIPCAPLTVPRSPHSYAGMSPHMAHSSLYSTTMSQYSQYNNAGHSQIYGELEPTLRSTCRLIPSGEDGPTPRSHLDSPSISAMPRTHVPRYVTLMNTVSALIWTSWRMQLSLLHRPTWTAYGHFGFKCGHSDFFGRFLCIFQPIAVSTWGDCIPKRFNT